MIEIKTKRLVLRRLAMEHAADVAATLNNFEVTKNLAVVPYPYSEADANEWIQSLDDITAVEDTKFAILNAEDNFVGVLGFDLDDAKPILGYYLNQAHWGKGYMSEAVSAALEWLFANSDVQTVGSGAFTFNPASLAIQYKLGFKDVSADKRLCLAQGQQFAHIVTQLNRQDFTPL
ncbi:GNAT family N-acetyltransferase [Maritalea porphyrae]|jgi:RimJ/RimL family protein N-acetyltransferase|uniref:GNAT family N-acetyltransferase n=1 Tax=Maritalea porphyrae TaxID=880732 RepID=UPI0022B0088D|nr:GNAT family N-acetyltransferase [Maritalea porphyrae]MCZ4271651.1 GNAT family N-acetyltransferase [Maritalea porphyrae]